MDYPSVAGLDCGKSSVHLCFLNEPPQDLKKFCRSYKALILKPNKEDLETLLAIPADLFVLEPTGSYSRIWVDVLQKAGRNVRLVNPRRIRHFAQYHGVINKSDAPDAAAIAAYSITNFHDSSAFLKSERIQLRDVYLALTATTRNKSPMGNRLGQRLSYECPELVTTYESRARGWLSPVPTVLRFIAGEEGYGGRGRQEKLDNTIAWGLSDHSRDLARNLINLEETELKLEEKLAVELANPEYDPYHRALDKFRVPPVVRAAILSAIYPFQDFLKDGRPIKEYVHGENSKRRSGKTKRDRSAGAFKICLGMGKVLSQSGSVTEWKPGGSKYARTALWQYVKTMIVMPRGRMKFTDVSEKLEAQYRCKKVSPWLNEALINAIVEYYAESPVYAISPWVADLMLHFEFSTDKKGDRRTSSTAGRFCRLFYRELLKEFTK